MTEVAETAKADRVAANATGAGIGLLAFMLAWLAGDRILTMIFSVPTGPVVAMSLAIVIGVLVAVRVGRCLASRFRD